jgi:hypothetical protein
MSREFKLFATWVEQLEGCAIRQRALVGVYDSHAGALRGIEAHQSTFTNPQGDARCLNGFEIEGERGPEAKYGRD